MSQEQIILISSDRGMIVTNLYDSPLKENPSDGDSSAFHQVFDDQEYSFQLKNIDMENVLALSVYINDDEQEISFDDDKFFFLGTSKKKARPFKNKFGFAEITILIQYYDGRIATYYSDFLSIMVNKDNKYESIKTMIEYVYNNHDRLLFTGSFGNMLAGDIKKGGEINLETKIALAQGILKLYKDYYGYFSANSRFKMRTIDVVDDANKLQSISSKTLQYIATHPGLLQCGTLNGGFNVGHRRYLPQKTLVEKKEYSFDIYENQVIVGFLGRMVDDINLMITEALSLLRNHENKNNGFDEYIQSSYLFFQHTEKTLRDNLMCLNSLKDEYEVMLNLYRRALGIDGDKMSQLPMPSAIFMSVAQYNNIYNHIQRWFEYGVYSFENERFMMSFINSSTLYEVYCLSKLLESINSLGFEHVEQYRFVYRTSKGTSFRNTWCNNTFCFRRGKEKLTLYYQPLIVNSDYKASNGINLYRNNSLAVGNVGSFYYTPDYLIKCEAEGTERYLILDAKFGSRDFVRLKQASNLVFKYLFSISPRENQSIRGLCILYGQGQSKYFDKRESIYDKNISSQRILPIFDIVPISTEYSNERHMELLMSAVSDFLSAN